MNNILTQICRDKRDHIKRCKKRRPFSTVSDDAKKAAKPRGFADKLSQAVADGGYGLIAEIKRGSPSQGLIRPDFRPAELAKSLEAGGATCLSVLTDAPYFQGSNNFLSRARTATNLAVLRKDFILDPYQVVESRALGADCILLIMAMLDDFQAAELHGIAVKLSMDVLLEVHNEDELQRALKLDAALIGINNRNLDTFAIDISTTERLAPLVTPGRILVSESGLSNRDDLERMSKCGVKCFLVGESLMRQDDVEAAVSDLLSSPPGNLKVAG